MIIKNKITYRCLTCKKKLKTTNQYQDCYHKNHLMRITGQFLVPAKGTLRIETVGIGKAKHSAKKGETVRVKL